MHRNLSLSLLRQFDYENYIGSIFLPHRLRNLALVVRLFDFQLSQIPYVVKSSELACSRYRFWREAIDRVYDDSIICNTPIEKALKKCLHNSNVSKNWFTALIKARENHFALKPFDTLADLELYSDQTCSSILFILAQALGHASTDLDHALSHLGKSQGILRLVRGIVPLARLHRALILPTDLLCQHNLTQESVIRLCLNQPKVVVSPLEAKENLEKQFCGLCFDLVSRAHYHASLSHRLAHKFMHKASKSLDKQDFPFRLFLPLIPLSCYLADINRYAQFDVRRMPLRDHDGTLPLRMLIHVIFRAHDIPPPPKY